MSAKNSDLYAGKTILAPMVRAGRTSLRNLVLEYGADLVYTEEIIDEKLLKTRRNVNGDLIFIHFHTLLNLDILQTVDYQNDDEIVLRISNTEKPKCVLQVGSCSPENLVAVCKKV
jgi:tRNA-dihydrouridine synthase 2